MEEHNPFEIAERRLACMNYIGLNPRNQTLFRICMARIWIGLTFTSMFLQVLYLFTTTHKNITGFIVDFLLVLGMSQIFYQIYTCHAKRKTLMFLIETMFNKFWTIESLNIEQNEQIQRIYGLIAMFTKLYKIALSVTLTSYFISTYFRNDYNLYLNIWLPDRGIVENSPNYEIILVIEAIFMVVLVYCCYVQIVMVSIVIIGNVFAQLEILKYNLNTIGNSENLTGDFEKIRKCVEHHNLLLDYLTKVEEFNSNLIFYTTGSNMLLSVLTLFAILNEDNLTSMVTLIFICCAANSQVFIYCLEGQIVGDQTQSIGDAAYNCNWEAISDRNVRLGLLLIIRRSQKPFYLTIGGIFILGLESFTQIAKLTYSFLTFMINLKGKQ